MKTKNIENFINSNILSQDQIVKVNHENVAYSDNDVYEKLLNLNKDLLVLKKRESIGLCLAEDAINSDSGDSLNLLAYIHSLKINQFGDPKFIKNYGLKMAYMTINIFC